MTDALGPYHAVMTRSETEAAKPIMPSRRRVLRLSLGLATLAAGGLAAMPLAAALDPDQLAAVLKAERYLNEVRSLRSRFVQVASNGAYSEGEVFINRPGRMRFEYDPPNPILLIADGTNLLYYDKELKQATFIPLWETPLWFLIRKKVDLSGDVQVTAIEQQASTLRMTLQDVESADLGAVTLVFSDRPFALRSWEVTDAQGITTNLTLINPDFGAKIDKSVFDYGDLDVYGFQGGRDRR